MDDLSTKLGGGEEAQWPTTEVALTSEEEATIVTVVVVAVAILAAIIFLFSMGVFIDCRTQNTITSTGKRKRLGLKMPPVGRAQRQRGGLQRLDDSKYLASDMCPNDTSSQPTSADLGIAIV